ncbi:Hypothetical predicted protein, partial [Paramuricea clavata]
MSTEDNYQSLRVNAASYDAGNRAGNDDDSTYTELSKTRDVEYHFKDKKTSPSGSHSCTGWIKPAGTR